MPVREPIFDPPFNIVRASHVELGVRDLGRARAFYVDCLGLLLSDETKDALYLRGIEERNHHSIVLRRAREPEAHALGYKLASEEDLDRAAFWFGRRNLPTVVSGPAASGTNAPHRRYARHAARPLRADGPGRNHAAAIHAAIRARASSGSIISTASRRTCRRAMTSITNSAFA